MMKPSEDFRETLRLGFVFAGIYITTRAKTQVGIGLFFSPCQKGILSITKGPFYVNSTQEATSQHSF